MAWSFAVARAHDDFKYALQSAVAVASLPITPANETQKQLIAALESKDVDIVGAFGPSGTGKSFVTCLYGLRSIEEGKYRRFIIVRALFDVSLGKRYSAVELGDLFFDMSSSYLYDIASAVGGEELVKKLMSEGKLVLADPSFLFGRTFDKSLIFLDDVQHVPLDVVREAMLRLGNDSKLVVAGDPILQASSTDNTAAIAREVILGQERSFVVDFGIKDIVRPGAKRALKLALEAKLRNRVTSEEERKIESLVYTHAPDARVVTVVDLRRYKEKYSVKTSPDVLIISKEGYLGRLIGKGGERIERIERDAGVAVRGVEASLDFKQLIVSVHPVSWIKRHLGGVDVVSANLEVEVDTENFGAFIGQRGIFIRFLDDVLHNVLGVGVRAKSMEMKREGKKVKRR